MRRKFNKIPKLHIKRGDTVVVLSGDEDIKGKQGLVIGINPEKRVAVVQDIRMVTRHIKKTKENPRGSVVQVPARVHVSKLQLIDSATGKPTRVGRQKSENDGWVRVSKKTGELIN